MLIFLVDGLRHQTADPAFDLWGRQAPNWDARDQRTAAQTEQIAHDEQAVGGRSRRAIAINIKQRLNGGEVGTDLGCAACGRSACNTACDGVCTEAQQESQHHHAVSGRVIARCRSTGINVQ